MAKQLRDITESNHIHVHPIGRNQFKVHSVGSKVNPTHAKVGDTFNSTELDDLGEGGYKVKEKSAPKGLKEAKEEPELAACQKCGKKEHLSLLDTKNNRKILCVACYGDGWNPMNVKSFKDSIRPDLKPHYDNWKATHTKKKGGTAAPVVDTYVKKPRRERGH